MKGKILITGLALAACCIMANQTLIDLPANLWYEVSNTHLMDVTPDYQYLWDNGIWCVGGPSNVVSSWCGGAYDPVHHKMIVWGGGHADYCGNEVYTFRLSDLKWERYTEPSTGSWNRDPLADGKPVSRHTYDGLQYIVHADRFFGYGGSRSRDGGGTRVSWTFNMNNKTWENRNPAGSNKPGSGHVYNLSSGYDPVTKKIFMRDPYSLYSYDYDANTWTGLKSWSHSWGEQRGVVDFTRRLYFTVGDGEFQVWDIDNSVIVTSQWTTTGGSAIISARSPGVDYDIKADALVAWKGGAAYALNLDTKAWTQKSGSGAPSSQNGNGTYGRWRYVPEYNVFVLVNSARQNVHFYKHTAGGPPAGGEMAGTKGKGLDIRVVPNPFNAIVKIAVSYQSRPGGTVRKNKLEIYNVCGKLVEKLTTDSRPASPAGGQGGQLKAGITWNPSSLPEGVYLLKLEVNEKQQVKKLFLIR